MESFVEHSIAWRKGVWSSVQVLDGTICPIFLEGCCGDGGQASGRRYEGVMKLLST